MWFYLKKWSEVPWFLTHNPLTLSISTHIRKTFWCSICSCWCKVFCFQSSLYPPAWEPRNSSKLTSPGNTAQQMIDRNGCIGTPLHSPMAERLWRPCSILALSFPSELRFCLLTVLTCLINNSYPLSSISCLLSPVSYRNFLESLPNKLHILEF